MYMYLFNNINIFNENLQFNWNLERNDGMYRFIKGMFYFFRLKLPLFVCVLASAPLSPWFVYLLQRYTLCCFNLIKTSDRVHLHLWKTITQPSPALFRNKRSLLGHFLFKTEEYTPTQIRPRRQRIQQSMTYLVMTSTSTTFLVMMQQELTNPGRNWIHQWKQIFESIVVFCIVLFPAWFINC